MQDKSAIKTGRGGKGIIWLKFPGKQEIKLFSKMEVKGLSY